MEENKKFDIQAEILYLKQVVRMDVRGTGNRHTGR